MYKSNKRHSSDGTDYLYPVTAYQKSQLPCGRNKWCLFEGTYSGCKSFIVPNDAHY